MNSVKFVDREIHDDTIYSTPLVLVTQNIVLQRNNHAYGECKKSTGEKVP